MPKDWLLSRYGFAPNAYVTFIEQVRRGVRTQLTLAAIPPLFEHGPFRIEFFSSAEEHDDALERARTDLEVELSIGKSLAPLAEIRKEPDAGEFRVDMMLVDLSVETCPVALWRSADNAVVDFAESLEALFELPEGERSIQEQISAWKDVLERAKDLYGKEELAACVDLLEPWLSAALPKGSPQLAGSEAAEELKQQIVAGFNRRGLTHRKLGDAAAAVKDLRQAKQYRASLSRYVDLNLMETYCYHTKDYDDVVDDFEHLSMVNPTPREEICFHKAQGLAYLMLGNNKAAKKHYRKLRKKYFDADKELLRPVVDELRAAGAVGAQILAWFTDGPQ